MCLNSTYSKSHSPFQYRGGYYMSMYQEVTNTQ